MHLVVAPLTERGLLRFFYGRDEVLLVLSQRNRFGGLVMIYGTLATSLIALLIAVPVSLPS